MAKDDVRWTVFKDYYKDGDHLTDTWCILYGTEAEANAAKTRLEAGQDKSWYDAEGDESPVLYVDQVLL